MEPEFQTSPPFVIKIYFDCFNISEKGNSDKPEDDYKFKDVKSLNIISGKLDVKGTIAKTILDSIFDVYSGVSCSKRFNLPNC